MNIIQLTKDQITPGPQLKRPDKLMKYKHKAFIKEFGFIEPLLVQKQKTGQYEIIKGRELFMIGKGLGVEQYNCILLPEGYDANFIRLMVNILSYENDLIEVSSVINQLPNRRINDLPFSNDMIETFKQLLRFDWNQYHKDQINKQTDLI